MFWSSCSDGTSEEDDENIGSIDKRHVRSVEDISGYSSDKLSEGMEVQELLLGASIAYKPRRNRLGSWPKLCCVLRAFFLPQSIFFLFIIIF